jgi:sulfite reductase (ferredoxin)
LNYYDAKGEKIFLRIFKPLADLTNLTDADFIDWGNADNYVKAMLELECAGEVVIDLVATLLLEAKDKINFLNSFFDDKMG